MVGGGCTPVPNRVAPTPTTGLADVPRPAFRPTSVTWISASHAWVLGTGPTVLRTDDGGASWVKVQAPPASAGVRKIRFADERNGWTYGPDLWATHDGGASWRRIESLPGPTTSLSTTEGMAYAVTGRRVFTTDAGGDAWRPAGADEVDAYASLAGGYVVGADNAVRVLTTDGMERRGTPCPAAAALLGIAGADVVAVCVRGGALGLSTKALVVSSDGAHTWTPAGTPPAAGSVVGVAGASPSTIVVGSAGGASSLYRTEDGGQTWATVHTEPDLGSPLEDLGFADETHGAAVLGDRVLLTADAGLTWSPASF